MCFVLVSVIFWLFNDDFASPLDSRALVLTIDIRMKIWTTISLPIWTLLIWIMAASATRCCVPRCGTAGKDGTILHSFPNPDMDMNRYIAWTQAVGMDTSLDPKFVHKYRRVCHNHFESRFLTWTRRLSRDAVPTLLLPGSNMARVPLLEITNEVENVSFDAALPSTSKGSNMARVPLANELENVLFDASVPSTSKGESSGQEVVGLSAPKASATVWNRPGKKSNEKELIKKIKKLQLKKKSYARRLQNALTLSENKTFQKAVAKFTTLAAMFTIMQFREIKKYKMGRRFMKKNIFRNCKVCKNNLYDENNTSDYLKMREYKKGKMYLTYPNQKLIVLFSKMQDLITYVLKHNPIIANIKSYLKECIKKEIDFLLFDCEKHSIENIDYIINLTSKFFICNWCKDVNKIISGKTIVNDITDDDEMKMNALNYFKRKKHHKKH